MLHFTILIHIVTLIVGSWMAFYSFQMYKTHNYSFIRSLVAFIIFLNLWILLDLASKYVHFNIMEYDYDLRYKVSWGMVIRHPLSFLTGVGMVYAFIRMIVELLEKAIPVTLKRLFFTGVMIFVFLYVVAVTTYISSISYRWFFIADWSSTRVGIFLIYSALIYLFIHRKLIEDPKKQKVVLAFGLLYFTGFTFPVVIFILRIYGCWAIISALLLLLNLVPIIWFKLFFLKYYIGPPSIMENDPVLDTITEKYNISKREREIMELLMRGKSNREIENILFISLNTVRNHIYSLYRKLGVKSRGQLVHLIMNAQKRD